MRERLKETTKEAFSSVIPITAIVLVFSVVVSPMSVGTLVMFLFGALLLVAGMGLFTMGADMLLIPLGEDIGVAITRTKKLTLVMATSFLMGVIITVAEPDLQVLAELVPGVPNVILILTTACGVGVFLVFSILRILFRIRLSHMLVASYAAVFILSLFAPVNFIPVAFDSGGVTTGSITVPFILAMGLGLASIRSDKSSSEDSFGLAALCSVGPILTVLVLGICYRPDAADYVIPVIPTVDTTRDAAMEFVRGLPQHVWEVAMALWPILAVMAVFQLITRRYHLREAVRILVGFVYTLLGLILYMTGVSVGFIPVGQSFGADIAASPASWLLVPLSAVIGYFAVEAEPAVHVLCKQVEEVSGGAIPGVAMRRYLAVGMAIALAISLLRVLTGIPIYIFLVPGYAIAGALTFVVPQIFTGIAFDSGGVASGPMTSTFLLPFALGACRDPEKILTDAFGLVAMISITPVIAVQLMGLIYNRKRSHATDIDIPDGLPDDIVDFDREDVSDE